MCIGAQAKNENIRYRKKDSNIYIIIIIISEILLSS